MSLKDRVLRRLRPGSLPLVVLHGLLVRLAKGKHPTKVFPGSELTAHLCFVRSVQVLATNLYDSEDPTIREFGIRLRRIAFDRAPHRAHEEMHEYLLRLPDVSDVNIVSLDLGRLEGLPSATLGELKQLFPHSDKRLYIVLASYRSRDVFIC